MRIRYFITTSKSVKPVRVTKKLLEDVKGKEAVAEHLKIAKAKWEKDLYEEVKFPDGTSFVREEFFERDG